MHLVNVMVSHLIAAKRVLRYLNGTMGLGILFQKSFLKDCLRLQAFSNSDWAGDFTDRRSTTGHVIFLGSNPIYWGC